MANPTLFDPIAALAEIRRYGPEKLSQKLSQPPARENHEIDHEVNPTLATLATLAGYPSAHDVAPARVQKVVRKNYIIISYTYARDARTFRRSRCRAWAGPARVARPARVSLSHCEITKTPETVAARVFEGELREWRSALAALAPDRAPCPCYRGDEWARTLARALSFLDTFGAQAEALGWTASRLFGVHPKAGIVRVDACGALVLPIGGAVRAITATEMVLGHLTHREKPGQPQGVPIWEFGR